MVDRANLEDEVCSRCIFSFYARKEFEKWKAERVGLEILLEQANGYTHYLVGDLEILCSEVFYLRDELRRPNEVKAQNNFALGLLESKCDSTRTQLSLAQGEFESGQGHAHSKLEPKNCLVPSCIASNLGKHWWLWRRRGGNLVLKRLATL